MKVFLNAAGALPEIWIAATHGLFVDDARVMLALDAVRGIWVTDSIAHDHHAWPQLHIVSVAPLLAEGLMEIHGAILAASIY